MTVRTRFAPSPTGYLHIGGLRTALYAYLFAKKNDGVFILRIEDTDQARFVEGAVEKIYSGLRLAGLEWDEGPDKGGNYGPYVQSERKDMYLPYAKELVEKGKAYYCFCTKEDLDARRAEAEARGETFKYDKHCLHLSKEEVQRRLDAGEPYVIRQNIPESGEAGFDDVIYGRIDVDCSELDDGVLIKSDGMPTYHLANVVDDYLMKITHVIRGEEWLPSLPLHVLLYRSFGWENVMPEFAHLPLILKPVGNGKLSKRDGNKMGFPVFPMQFTDPETGEIWHGYKEDGYFPEAFINMLALLGWNDGTDQEIFSMEELCQAFSLERVHKAGSRFDPEKAKWFNHKYLITKSDSELAGILNEILQNHGIQAEQPKIERICGLMKERANFVTDIYNDSLFFFKAPESYNEKDTKKYWKEESVPLMQELYAILEKIDDYSFSNTEKIISEWITSRELGFGKVMNPFRVAIVGAAKGPHMFDIIEVIGKEETLRRLKKALETL